MATDRKGVTSVLLMVNAFAVINCPKHKGCTGKNSMKLKLGWDIT